MKKSEIRVGGTYLAKVSNSIIPVRVDAVRPTVRRGGKDRLVYDVTNTVTGRKTTFRSASKFRGEIVEKKTSPEPVRKITATPTPNGMTSQIIDTPVKLVAALGNVLNGTETAEQVKARIPILDSSEKKTVAERRERSLNGTGNVDKMYQEIREYEARVGKPWFTFALKGESWESFKRRGCPTEKPQEIPLVVPAKQRGYAGLDQDRVETPKRVERQPESRSPVLAQSTQPQRPSANPSPSKPRVVREGVSNKEIVYRKWLESTTIDVAATAALVPDVQLSSVKSWLKAWEKGVNLPSCAKDFPPSLRGKGTKKETAPNKKGTKK